MKTYRQILIIETAPEKMVRNQPKVLSADLILFLREKVNEEIGYNSKRR